VSQGIEAAPAVSEGKTHHPTSSHIIHVKPRRDHHRKESPDNQVQQFGKHPSLNALHLLDPKETETQSDIVVEFTHLPSFLVQSPFFGSQLLAIVVFN